jgi:hypothetical protein
MTAVRNDKTEDGTIDDLPDGDPEKAPWSKDQMLMATLIDEVRALRHAYTLVHAKKGSAHKAPQPVPRPGVKRRRRSRLTPEQRMMLDPRLRKEAADGGRA